MFGFKKKHDDGPVRVGRPAVVPRAAEPQRQAEPVTVIYEEVEAPAAGAQVIALAPVMPRVAAPVVTVPPADQVIEQPTITSNADIPSYSSVLTGHTGKPFYKLSKALEHALIALETGPKRAIIYYNPKAPHPETRSELNQLRVKLVSNGYDVPESNTALAEDVIRLLLANNPGGADYDAVAASNSEKKVMWESWFDMCYRERASDIHITGRGNSAKVQMRVDGEIYDLPDAHNGKYPSKHVEGAVAWAFGEYTAEGSNNASLFSPRAPIYAMFKPRVIDGKKVAMRFQSLPGAYGFKVIGRFMEVNEDSPTLAFSFLGYERSHIQLFSDAQSTHSGLVLFSGVTGSGKTISTKTYIETHPDNGRAAFYEMGDPCEIPLRNVHSISVQRDLSDPAGSIKKYNETMAGIVRGDPDGLIMSEIRDIATAQTAQSFVESGHFAIGTAHARFISGIAARLEMVGMPRSVFTSPGMINLLVYQALVPKVCLECNIGATEVEKFKEVNFGHESNDANLQDNINELQEMLSLIEKKFGVPRNKFRLTRAGGCSKCKHRGTKGSTAVAEMISPDERWIELTREKKDQEAVNYYRTFSDGDVYSSDMNGKLVFEHALYKATLGIIDPRSCQTFETFKRFKVITKESQK